MRARPETLVEEKGNAVTFPRLSSRVEQQQKNKKRGKNEKRKSKKGVEDREKKDKSSRW